VTIINTIPVVLPVNGVWNASLVACAPVGGGFDRTRVSTLGLSASGVASFAGALQEAKAVEVLGLKRVAAAMQVSVKRGPVQQGLVQQGLVQQGVVVRGYEADGQQSQDRRQDHVAGTNGNTGTNGDTSTTSTNPIDPSDFRTSSPPG
jgi:hypothetical protein